ncbi:hypothetical protein BRD02_08435 [Halobacteriales archaeon QS_8_69_73]|nr:MAG: hypothetical protein BRD02_08435 [Halobacteriales archaeon QS_8_69_73]
MPRPEIPDDDPENHSFGEPPDRSGPSPERVVLAAVGTLLTVGAGVTLLAGPIVAVRPAVIAAVLVAFLLGSASGPELPLPSALAEWVGGDRVDRRELALAVYARLPEREQLTAGGGDVELTESGRVAGGRPRQIAEELRRSGDADPDADRVARALEELESSLSDVHATADGRYYREKPVGYDDRL